VRRSERSLRSTSNATSRHAKLALQRLNALNATVSLVAKVQSSILPVAPRAASRPQKAHWNVIDQSKLTKEELEKIVNG
jgi:hypothetical protein